MRTLLNKALIRNNSKEFLRTNLLLGLVTVFSVLSISLETVSSLSRFGDIFITIEYIAVIIFFIEYVARIYIHEDRLGYIFSFFGIIDIISIIPSLFGIFNLTFLKAARIVRVLTFMRTLRLAKLAKVSKFSNANSKKVKEIQFISVKIYTLVLVTTITAFGTLLYVIEGGSNSTLGSIPAGIFWATQSIFGGSMNVDSFSAAAKALSVFIQFTGLLLFGLLIHLVGTLLEKGLLGSTNTTK